MKEIMGCGDAYLKDLGMFAVSRAGHDAGHRYVIIRETEDCVYLADGEVRKLDNPKRKNRRHMQIIKNGVSTVLKDKLKNNQPVNNEEIKYTIKAYFK